MPIKLLIEGQVIEVDERFAEVSELIKTNWQPGTDDEIPISNTQVSLEAFKVIRSYYEFNSFQPKLIERIDENPDVCYLNSHDKELIGSLNVFQGDQLKALLNAAIYLNMKAFKKLCQARIAIEFFLDKTKPNESFNKMKAAHNLSNLTLTLGDVERHKKVYPQLVASFI